jgi:hypothetical protein
MTLVINQLLDQQSLDDEIHAQAPSGVVDEAPQNRLCPFGTSVQNQTMNILRKSLPEICRLLKLLLQKVITYATKVQYLTLLLPKKITSLLGK